MPTFIRPQKVTVTEGGGGLAAALAVVVVLAAVASALSAQITDALVSVLAGIAVLCVGGIVFLVRAVRRDGGLWLLRDYRRPASTPAAPRPATGLSAPRQLAIENRPPRPALNERSATGRLLSIGGALPSERTCRNRGRPR